MNKDYTSFRTLDMIPLPSIIYNCTLWVYATFVDLSWQNFIVIYCYKKNRMDNNNRLNERLIIY